MWTSITFGIKSIVKGGSGMGSNQRENSPSLCILKDIAAIAH